jgi:PilZ domain
MDNECCVFEVGARILDEQPVETTLYSLSAAAPNRPDRRHGERHLSLLRVGALLVGGRRELCLIRNVSAGGMMIRPYSLIQPGSRLSIELKHGHAVSGVAQWYENGLVGVTFDSPIDVVALLSTANHGPAPRMPRMELNCIAWVRQDADVYRTRAVNISQGGMCVRTEAELAIGADVVVSLPGLAPAAGVLKWSDRDGYGIGFNRVFAVDELMRFLKGQQRQDRRHVTG